MKRYALDNSWSDADKRLNLLEIQLDSKTQKRFSKLGVKSGSNCLEVGAGRGSVVKWLSGQVGETGRVVAVDINTDLLNSIGLSNVEVRKQDVRVEPLPQGMFDLVHARWILWHLPDPDAVIHQMIQSLRPGGWLLIEEADYFPLEAVPKSAYRAFMESLVGTLSSESGGSAYWARALLEKITGSELDKIGAQCDTQIVQGATPLAELYALTGQQVRERMIASGTISSEQFNEALTSLDSPDFFAFACTEIAIWGQKKP